MAAIKPPENIRKVLRCLADSGHAAYLVGGCVRDSVMGRPVHDWDIASSATPGEVEGIFKKTVLTGEKYGTVTVIMPECTVEVTTFRTESGYRDGRRPSVVEFVTSLDEDLSRRDFTMNAIAVSISGDMIDPYGGLDDIMARVIRCVGTPDDRFKEDALRMLRAYRFSAELRFMIEPGTKSSIIRNAEKTNLISAERVRVELEKTLLSPSPEIAGEMIKAGLVKRYLSTAGKQPGGINKLSELPLEAALRWCAFCAILSENGMIENPGDFLSKMRLDSNTIKICKTALAITGLQDGSEAFDKVGIKKLIARHGAAGVRCAAAVCDALYSGSALKSTEEVLRSGECFSTDTLAVTGNDLISLGCPPGRGIGKILAALLSHVIEYPEDNTREALLDIIEVTDNK